MSPLAISPVASFAPPELSTHQRRATGGLAILALAVLAVHAWLLTTSPSQISPSSSAAIPSTPPPFTAAMETRRIEPLPPPAPAATENRVVAPAPKPLRKPVPKQKRPVAPEIRAQTAPELIAKPAPQDLPQEAPPAPTPDAQALADARQAENDAGAATSAALAVAAVASNPTAPSSAAVPALPALPQTTAVTAMALPGNAELKYKATGMSKGLTYHANTELAWYHDGTSYNARMTLSAFLVGSFVWSSAGQVGAQGLAPTRFAEKKRTEVAAHFEPDKGQIIFSANTPSAQWIKGAQDRATVFIQMAGMLAGDPSAFPPGSSISLYTVGPRSADVWTFVVEPIEVVNLPAGDMPALKLVRKPRDAYDNKVELWLAPSLGYLPVRSKVTQADGAFVDQQLSDVKRF